jgi:hypothetical protein
MESSRRRVFRRPFSAACASRESRPAGKAKTSTPPRGPARLDQRSTEAILERTDQDEDEVHDHADKQQSTRQEIEVAAPPLSYVEAMASQPAEEEAEQECGRATPWSVKQDGF